MTTTPVSHRVTLKGPRTFWAYLALITAAELLTAVDRPRAGLTLHAMILVGLMAHAALASGQAERAFALGLTLAPLIRMFSLSLPLPGLPQLAWYPAVAAPVLVSTGLIIRYLRLSPREVGLSCRDGWLHAALGGAGIGLGLVEYSILQPAAPWTSYSWQTLWMPAASLVLFTGFADEIIFRGVLQSLSLPVLGRAALVYVSLLFAVMHIGYRSWLDVLLVFVVGLCFAYIVYWSGSIAGVTLAHGLTNTTLFMLVPYLGQSNLVQNRRTLALAVIFGALLSGLSAVVFFVRAWRRRSLSPAGPPHTDAHRLPDC